MIRLSLGDIFFDYYCRTSRSFLERFLRLASLSQLLGCTWFVPGLIQPIHALMILLVHLDGCICPEEEAILSRDLIDQVFSLRLSSILRGGTSINSTAPRFNNLRQHNSRYFALTSLKTRVWQKLGWSTTPCPTNLVAEVNPPDSAALQAKHEFDFGYEHPAGEDSISVLWDEFTAGESLDADIGNWDEWNVLSAGFLTE